MPRYTTLTLTLRLAGMRRRERRAPRERGPLFCACGRLSSSGWTDGDQHPRCCMCEVAAALKDMPARRKPQEGPQEPF